jgi:hypothetical protein
VLERQRRHQRVRLDRLLVEVAAAERDAGEMALERGRDVGAEPQLAVVRDVDGLGLAGGRREQGNQDDAK